MMDAPKTDFALDVICGDIALEIVQEAPLDKAQQIQLAYERAHDHEFATYDWLALAVCSNCDVGNGVNLGRVLNASRSDAYSFTVFYMARMTVNLEMRHRIIALLNEELTADDT